MPRKKMPVKEGDTSPYPMRQVSIRELGSIKGGRHTKCPCCGYLFAVGLDKAEEALMRRATDVLNQKVHNHTREFLANSWRVGVIDAGNTGQKVSTPSIPRVYNTGTGHALRMVYRDAVRHGYDVWFAIAWQDVPVMTENLFVCTLGSLFKVLRALADDSADFAARLQRVVDVAYKRDWSASPNHIAPLDLDGSRDGREDGGLAFDSMSAVDA